MVSNWETFCKDLQKDTIFIDESVVLKGFFSKF